MWNKEKKKIASQRMNLNIKEHRIWSGEYPNTKVNIIFYVTY